ncbi:Mbeg1-like protein [Paenibacillus riograndensis]|uniref:Mbeg1-like protein n=1 Tax=Paenibacillus riograndensis TaxID=483937 RepID=UPI000763D1B1|nr:Mbeg1-like protein [Paenibacillus riograndensis]
MGNILSYLKWRGDLSLNERPFNEVDNLILSALSYFDLEGIVPELGQGKSITVKEASELYFNNQHEKNAERLKRLSIIDHALLKEMAQSERFTNARLSNFIDIMDDARMMQFSAVLIELEDDTNYIAYRGTDNSILGWREDFTISFQTVSAQQSALAYLESVIVPGVKRYRVGGHSKGGNLAMYASMMCGESAREQILEIYNNDGPGFCEDLPWAENMKKIQDRTLQIIPEFSVIGMLFTSTDTSRYIIESSATGLMQHHPMTWEVEGSAFVRKDDLTPRCKLINEMVDNWIEHVDFEQRKTFTNDLFDALGAGGASLVVDLTRGGVDGFEAILLALGRSDVKTKEAISTFFKSVITGCRKIDYIALLRTSSMIKGACTTLLGMFFMQKPEFTFRILGALFFFSIFSFSVYKYIRHLKKIKNHMPVWKHTSKLYFALLGLSSMILLKGDAFSVSTHLLLSLGFVFNAYLNFNHYLKSANIKRKNWVLLPNSILSFLLGIVSWVTANNLEVTYIFFMSGYLIISGVTEMIHSMIDNAQNRLRLELKQTSR